VTISVYALGTRKLTLTPKAVAKACFTQGQLSMSVWLKTKKKHWFPCDPPPTKGQALAFRAGPQVGGFLLSSV
jgi:hypothetical protein